MLSRSGEEGEWVLLELPLAAEFDLEKTVCSHGLFMMPPNHWDPLSKTFSRPLRFSLYDDDEDDDDSSVMVRISHPIDSPHSLHVRVRIAGSLSPKQQQTIMAQVARMLRLSDVDETAAREFRSKVKTVSSTETDCLKRFGGRIFRSPTLFEDMVKCILLCNCQWPRTLSMARALCKLQLELQNRSFSVSVNGAANAKSRRPETRDEHFIPKTPAAKELKRKYGGSKVSINLTSKYVETKADLEADTHLSMEHGQMTIEDTILSPTLSPSSREGNSFKECNICDTSSKLNSLDLYLGQRCSCGNEEGIGNFPSARELASLDESFLAERCNLGYRAGRVLNLARGIFDGRIKLKQLEEVGGRANLSAYDKLAEQLREIDGFGPFTCANVLMCLGYYHVIPTDSETVRHLKQVHSRKSTIQTVQKDVEAIYGKAEVWHFYEQWFGKPSKMLCSDYKLITASNMKIKKRVKTNRTKTS
ncbi:uncharacterized protein LOC120004348 isoform X2 [Tripterygium wilfordii]|uniref:uncharacterized protein LOC120004348 isoform X2 n=1 Tax=Tripterygium wilfordii TaxID=458696 RepID=UPI0018F80915|nr:uncharacterized protein LOC120004348 isoform X2 [Tripterygium wilfordii]